MCSAIKCVVVGDSGAGKTSILRRYVQKAFHESHDPTTACERHSIRVSSTLEGSSTALDIWDTSGANDYKRLRSMAYEGAELIVMCFSLENSSGISGIREHWLTEIRQYFSHPIPIILVGTKIDIRDDKDWNGTQVNGANATTPMVDYVQGFGTAKEIGAVAYVECSARRDNGLAVLFDTMAASGVYYRLQKEGKSTKCQCRLM